MSLDLDKIEAAARAAITETTPGNWRHHEDWNGKVFDGDEAIADCDTGADASFIASVSPLVALEMIALIRHQERELTEARERRSEPSAVRVTIVDERRQGLDMVDHRLRQILNPPAPFHGEKWAAADALYWLTGNQAFADQADGLAAESLNAPDKRWAQAELKATQAELHEARVLIKRASQELRPEDDGRSRSISFHLRDYLIRPEVSAALASPTALTLPE